jgi:hypothetical protein
MTPERKEHAMSAECHLCRLLQSEAWRLSQRLADAERRIEHLAQGLERLALTVQAMRRERRAS